MEIEIEIEIENQEINSKKQRKLKRKGDIFKKFKSKTGIKGGKKKGRGEKRKK